MAGIMEEFSADSAKDPANTGVNSEDNMLDLVMGVFERTKSISNSSSDLDVKAETIKLEMPKVVGDIEEINDNIFPVGAAEYAVYSKGLQIKARSPPPKPKRKKSLGSESLTERRGDDEERNGIGTELQEMIETAFGYDTPDGVSLDCSFDSPNKKLPNTPHPTPVRDVECLHFPDATDEKVATLTKDSVALQVGQNRSPSNGSFESKSMDSITLADGTDDFLADDANRSLYKRINSLSFDTISCTSVHSEGADSGDWRADDFSDLKRVDECESDSVHASRSSSPISGKARNKRKEKIKRQLVKAVAQKEKVGALLDAAAGNASDHLKRMARIKSVRLPGSRPKSQQSHDKIAISNANGQLDENSTTGSVDESFKTKLYPAVEKLLIPNNRQMAVKSGFLKKQSGGKIRTWNERWFVLKGDQLHYSKEEDGKPIASIFLPGTRLTVHPVRNNEANKYIFEIYPGSDGQKISSNRESYLLSASSQADMDEWVKVIKRVMLSPFGGGIFGQRLDETLRYDRRLDSSGCGTTSTGRSGDSDTTGRRKAPIIVESCVEFIRANGGLNEEGLFRLPGHANEVKELQDAYDNGERPVFPRTTDIHTVASLLKGYLRELPEPVIPFERYDALIGAAKLALGDEPTNHSEGNAASRRATESKIIKEQLNLLPQANFDLLRYLCRFLDEVQCHSADNKMDISNLAMVFGPNIMRSKRDDPQTMMTDASHVQHVMHQFIANHRLYFPDDQKTTAIPNMQSLPDVAIGAMVAANAERSATEQVLSADGGIGTLTSTVSPPGTLAQRNNTDDSGTGSLGPTPENTSKRVPPVQFPASPPRNKPNKPARRKVSVQTAGNRSELSVEDIGSTQRRSLYDNVTVSSSASNDAIPPNGVAPQHDRRWCWSNESEPSDASGSVSGSTTQESYYVNNRSTPAVSCASPRSSTNAVAGSDGTRESYNSNAAISMQLSRSNGKRRDSHKGSQENGCNSDNESNTESVVADDRAFSTLSSHRDSVDYDQRGHRDGHRSSMTSLQLDQRKSALDVMSAGNRLSTGSDVSSTSSLQGAPPVPSRPHRKIKRAGGGPAASSPRNSRAETDVTSISAGREANSDRSSQVVGSAANSVFSSGQHSLTYKELEEQVKFLQEELRKQRVEHEKRSRMLEEHYIMKMKNSSAGYSPFSAGASFSAYPAPYSPTSLVGSEDFAKSPFARSEGSVTDSNDPALSRRSGSIDSTAELRYAEEVKKHAMTKIRLRNAERGLQQAEERNRQLQKEMEDFFQTFGCLMDRSPGTS